MWQQFWIQNMHYVLESFLGFLMTIAGWIYLDGWLVERQIKTLIRTIGFSILAVWCFLGAVPLGLVAAKSFFETELTIDLLGLGGFGFVLLSLLIDPIPIKPGEKPIRFWSRLWHKSLAILPIGGISQRFIVFVLPPVIAFFALFVEFRIWMLFFAGISTVLLRLHYKRGIQTEWRFFYLGFLGLTVALFFGSLSLWRQTQNVLLAQFLAQYGIVWILEHAAKFIGTLALGVWAWGFIRFRIFPQIFSSFIALSFIIFVTTTILYTGFILNRTQDSIIENLETNVKTLDFAMGKVKESAILAARIASTNSQVREAVKKDDKDVLFRNLSALKSENETDFMLAVNKGGEVLMRAEDRERFGDSLADDPVVWRALEEGKAAVTTFIEPGVTVPIVSIRASAPIIDTGATGEPEIIGTIVTGFLLDTAFADGFKKLTNLDFTVYAHDISVATTFLAPGSEPGSQLRLVGTREVNQQILDTVLKQNKTYAGTAAVLNQPFLAVYIPIRDIEKTTIGMFFTGRSQASILAVINDVMRLTFSISILLMMISIIPVGWLARYISYHQKV